MPRRTRRPGPARPRSPQKDPDRMPGPMSDSYDLPELLSMNLQQGPERGVRRFGVTVLLAPDPVVPEESQEGRLVDVVPVPLRLEGRNRFGRTGQQRCGILAGRGWRSEPVPGDDAEVATAAASMCPPQVAIRVGRLPGRHDAARPSDLVHGDDF